MIPYDTERLLPSTGMLSFFFEGGEEIWRFNPKDQGAFKVIYTSDMHDLIRHKLPEDIDIYLRFSPCKLSYENRDSCSTEIYELNQQLFHGDTSDKYDDFFDLFLEEIMSRTIHEFLVILT